MKAKRFDGGEWKESKDENVIVGERTVAFIDILGFKSLIENNLLLDLAAAYEDVISQINKVNKNPDDPKRELLFPDHPRDLPFCKLYIFSDSLIIISNGPTQNDTHKTLIFAWRAFQQLLAHQLIPRGGVSHGEIYVNESRNIFLGKGLTTAYELEQNQEWVGAAISDQIWKSFPDLEKNISRIKGSFYDKLFMRYDVPLKNGKNIPLRTLNWRANLIIDKGAKSLFEMTGSETIDIKYKNALRYALVSRVFSDPESTPLELGYSWLGESPPPFKDGDEDPE